MPVISMQQKVETELNMQGMHKNKIQELNSNEQSMAVLTGGE